MTVRRIYAGKLIDVTGSGYEPKGSLLIDGKPIENPLEQEELKLLILGGTLCNDARLVKEDG